MAAQSSDGDEAGGWIAGESETREAVSTVRFVRSASRTDLVVAVWSLGLALVLLGPALGVGYVLTYDMVWVPDLAVVPDVWGVGSALPRAVPSDAVVALLDEVLPGAWLQHVVLLGSLVGGGLGAARLVGAMPGLTSSGTSERTARGTSGERPAVGLLARLVAVTLWQWNPFVVERLVIGHWPVLLAYAVLPWILVLAPRWREERLMPTALLLLVPIGSLSASAALSTAVVVVLAGAGRGRRRACVALLAAANAPWVVAGALHAGDATTDAAGAAVFALGGEGSVPAPLAALTLGGIWNVDVVPDSRLGALGWVALVLLLALAGAGARTWWRSADRRERLVLLGSWGIGYGVGLATWAAPGITGEVAATVPGVGLLRDGGRLLLLCAPLLVVLVTHGVLRIVRLLPDSRVALAGAGVAAALVPIALLPDAAWGVSGRLQATAYPSSWADARSALERGGSDAGGNGDVLVLPASSFRAPPWNGGRTVPDPLGRYLPLDAVADDTLVVGGSSIGGEDPRAAAALDALAARTPQERAEGLAALGIGVVAVDQQAADQLAAPTVPVAGEVVLDAPDLSVVALDDVRPRSIPTWWVLSAGLAWLGFGGLLVIWLVHSSVTTVRIVRRASRQR